MPLGLRTYPRATATPVASSLREALRRRRRPKHNAASPPVRRREPLPAIDFSPPQAVTPTLLSPSDSPHFNLPNQDPFDAIKTLEYSNAAFNRLVDGSPGTPLRFNDPNQNLTSDSSPCLVPTPEISCQTKVNTLIRSNPKKKKRKVKRKRHKNVLEYSHLPSDQEYTYQLKLNVQGVQRSSLNTKLLDSSLQNFIQITSNQLENINDHDCSKTSKRLSTLEFNAKDELSVIVLSSDVSQNNSFADLTIHEVQDKSLDCSFNSDVSSHLEIPYIKKEFDGNADVDSSKYHDNSQILNNQQHHITRMFSPDLFDTVFEESIILGKKKCTSESNSEDYKSVLEQGSLTDIDSEAQHFEDIDTTERDLLSGSSISNINDSNEEFNIHSACNDSMDKFESNSFVEDTIEETLKDVSKHDECQTDETYNKITPSNSPKSLNNEMHSYVSARKKYTNRYSTPVTFQSSSDNGSPGIGDGSIDEIQNAVATSNDESLKTPKPSFVSKQKLVARQINLITSEENSNAQPNKIMPQRRSMRLQKIRQNPDKNFNIFNKTIGAPNKFSSNAEMSVLVSSKEEPNQSIMTTSNIKFGRRSITLQPGKNWRRSYSILKQMSAMNITCNNTVDFYNETMSKCNSYKGRRYQESVGNILELQNRNDTTVTAFASIGQKSILTIVEEATSLDEDSDCARNSSNCEELFSKHCNDTEIDLSKLSISEFNRSDTLIAEHLSDEANWSDLNARDLVLRKCNQGHYLPFDECYPDKKLKNCQKIGEGVYGEVYLYKNEKDPTKPIVMKVIPIEGTEEINGEHQKKFSEIFSEIVIAMELSGLRDKEDNYTTTFNKVHEVKCVKGRYPERLLELWDLYDDIKGSENDCPSVFDEDQLYVVLELENGGLDLEAFTFVDAQQSYSIFCQIIFALAVAEDSLQFEHRDLHWGNILISPTADQSVEFTLHGVPYSIPTNGVSANIIDFTLSRVSLPQVGYNDVPCTIYNNLAIDEDLFNAVGDYQFEIYRLMREKIGNIWRNFEPFTNILWMGYILSKMIKGVRYESVKTKTHNIYINKLKKIQQKILNYDSCVDFVTKEM